MLIVDSRLPDRPALSRFERLNFPLRLLDHRKHRVVVHGGDLLMNRLAQRVHIVRISGPGSIRISLSWRAIPSTNEWNWLKALTMSSQM